MKRIIKKRSLSGISEQAQEKQLREARAAEMSMNAPVSASSGD